MTPLLKVVDPDLQRFTVGELLTGVWWSSWIDTPFKWEWSRKRKKRDLRWTRTL